MAVWVIGLKEDAKATELHKLLHVAGENQVGGLREKEREEREKG